MNVQRGKHNIQTNWEIPMIDRDHDRGGDG